MTAGGDFGGFGTERAPQAEGAPASEATPGEATPGEATASEATASEATVATTGSSPARGRSAALEEIAARPLAEHPDGYERLHDELRSALAEIDDA